MKGNLLKNRNVFKKREIEHEIYNPIVNYEIFDLKEEDRKKLIQFEKNIQFHQQKTAEHLIALAEILSEAQTILANQKNGGFKTWFEDLGLKKTFVYMCLRRYKLYVTYNKEAAMIIPEKLVNVLTTKEMEYKEVEEILSNDKPLKKYEEILEMGHNDIEIIEFVEENEKKKELITIIDKKYKEIENLNKEIKVLEKELSRYR